MASTRIRAVAPPTLSDVEIDGTNPSIDGTRLDFRMCCCLGRAPLCTRPKDGRRAPFGRRGGPKSGVPLPLRGAAPVCLRCPDRVAPASLAFWRSRLLPGPSDRNPVFRRCPVQEVVPRCIGVAVLGVLALSAPESRFPLCGREDNRRGREGPRHEPCQRPRGGRDGQGHSASALSVFSTSGCSQSFIALRALPRNRFAALVLRVDER